MGHHQQVIDYVGDGVDMNIDSNIQTCQIYKGANLHKIVGYHTISQKLSNSVFNWQTELTNLP